MSTPFKYVGRQGKGASSRMRVIKREEAEERNAQTPDEKRKVNRQS